ncbi:MAG TPA: hypothetical protein PKB07_19315, partial [Flavilitoribacter sp.]|nr:hypothetical protein [Flavilitoribacter sp.]
MKNTIPCLLLLAALSPVWANSSFQCDNYLQGGMIWTQQNPVILTYCDQFGLLPLTEVVAPSGGSGGAPLYQWAFSLDGAFWQPITVSAGQQRDLIPGSALLNFMLAAGMDYSQSTWFRRGVKRPECDDYVFSNIVEFRVFHQVSGPGQFRSVWEYCNDQNGLNASYFHTGNPNSVNPSGGDQPYEFQWEFSTDQVNWSNYSTAELPGLFITPGTIGYYRRGVKPAGSPCEYAFSNTIAISNVIPFELNLALDHPDCSDENTGRITVIDLSGNSPEILNSIAYSIDGGNSWQYSPVFDHLTAGFYTVQTQNKCSCPNGYSWCTAEAELTAAPAPEILDVDFIHPSDCGASDGSITIYGSGGIAPLKFSINGATYLQQTVFTGLPAGNYPISVQNADGSCERFFGSVTLNNPPQPIPEEVIQVNPTGCGASDGSIQVIASGGIQPLEFKLNSGSWTTGGVFPGLPAGVYQIGIRNAGGSCQTTTSTTLTSPAGPSIVSVDHSEPSDCSTADGTITINASGGTGNLQYNIGFGWINTPVFNNLSPGNYTISVRNQNGTCQVDYPAPIVLNGPSSPQISSINSTDPSDCNASDGSISVIASGNSGNLEYNIGLGWSSNSIFQGLPPGNYTVQVRNTNGTCLVTHPEVIVISGPLSPVIHQVSATNVSGCGVTDGTIEIIASGAGPLEYNIGIGWSVNSVFTGLEPGLYPIQVRNHDGSCLVNYPGAEEVAGPDLPVIIAVVASAPSDCEVADGAISIQMEDPTGEYEFTINGGNTWSAQPQFGGLSPGLYAVGVRDSDQSCFVDYGQVEITGIVSPDIIDVIFNNPSDCGTADGSIQIGATGINSLEYRVNTTDTWTANPLFEGLGPGDYQVQVRNSDGTCIINYPSLITLSSPPSPIIPSVNFTDPTDCGADDGSIQVHSISGTGTYEVSIDNGQTWFDHANFFNLPPGDYEVMVRNNGGTCVVEYDQIITLSNPPMPVISNIAVADPTDCGANDGTITISAGAGTGNFQFNIGGSWSSNSVFSGLSHGNYTVQVRNSNGTCPVEYDQIVSLTEPPLP